jgi:hypothetical protein
MPIRTASTSIGAIYVPLMAKDSSPALIRMRIVPTDFAM